MIRILAAASIALLAACNNDGGAGNNGTTERPAAQNDASTQITPQQAGDLPKPGVIPRFVGKWAADQKSCESAAWQFTGTTLRTPAGSSCSFEQVTEVPGGYDIEATCTAESPPAPDTLKVRFAESAKAMLFESTTIADTGLVFCGRDA